MEMNNQIILLAYWGLTQVQKYFSQIDPTLLAISATFRRVQTEVSPEVAGEGVGTKFSHPRDVLMGTGRVVNRSVHSCYSM